MIRANRAPEKALFAGVLTVSMTVYSAAHCCMRVFAGPVKELGNVSH